MKAEVFSLVVISKMQVWNNKRLDMGCWQKEWIQVRLWKIHHKKNWQDLVSEYEERELKMLMRFRTKKIWEKNGKEKLRVASIMGVCFFSSICKFKKALSSVERSSRTDGEASWKRYWYISQPLSNVIWVCEECYLIEQWLD